MGPPQTPVPVTGMLENANANTQRGESINANRDVIKLVVINSGPGSSDVVEALMDALPTLLEEIQKLQSKPTADGGVGTGVFASDDESNAENPPTERAKCTEYEKGRITCEICGMGVGFRDEETGGFTLKHWEAHRLTCSMPQAGQSSSTAEALAHPPTKRRRAKRTEEERIDYLRADPYVATFEAYRVLCTSCDKWIRLRPNSTYCLIPWDAHRKGCLAKKVNSKNVYALEERNALFSKDPDICKFDAERVLCSICDKWLSVNSDDHLCAVQKWLQHRAACQKNSTRTLPPNRPILHEPISAPPLTEQQMAMAIGPGPGATCYRRVQPPPPHSASPISPNPGLSFAQSNNAQRRNHTFDDSSFHDYNPSNCAPSPTHEFRRRNAEQRAAILRADSLISEVEPNRVFCSLCQKWVQLRRDSSYCSYPWLQHRGKCLARHQRWVQKATETANLRNRKHTVSTEEEDELMPGNDGVGGTDGPESEEGLDSHAEEDWFRRKKARRVDPSHAMKDLQRGNNGKARARSAYQFPPYQNHSRYSLDATSTSSSAYRHDPHAGPLSYHRISQRRVQKAAETAHLRNRKHSMPTEEEDELMSENDGGGVTNGPESEEGLNSHAEEDWFPRKKARRVEPRHATKNLQRGNNEKARARSTYFPPHQNQSRDNLAYRHDSRSGPFSYHRIWDDVMDGEADGGIDVDTYDEDRPISSAAANRAQPIRHPLPVGLAELGSPAGRRDFVLASIEYLLHTTYETDDSAPNTAMPQDQHEDSDNHQ